MAPKAIVPELPPIFSLEFIDTHFGKELLNDNNLQSYNNLFYLVERVETLFIEEEDIYDDNAEYKSDLLSPQRYQCHISPICTHFHLVIYKSILGEDMPRIFEVIMKDLALIGAWWLVSLEVVRQYHFGVAKRCKMDNHKPYPHLPFKIVGSIIIAPPRTIPPSSFKIPSLGSVFSPITPYHITTSPTTLESSTPFSSDVPISELSIIPSLTPSS
eukprot:Gb_27985 [translate_table: standard]